MRTLNLWLVVAMLVLGCGEDEPVAKKVGDLCDAEAPNSCGDELVCAVRDGEARCEKVELCDPAADACSDGLTCRPSAQGFQCLDRESAGRIIGCEDTEAFQLFVVEADSALSLTWEQLGAGDSSGGYRVLYGTVSGEYTDEVTFASDARAGAIRPLDNDTLYFLKLEALNGNGNVTLTSCEVFGTPHRLKFQPDVQVSGDGIAAQPALVSNAEGTELVLAWEESGVQLSRSQDFGDTWSAPLEVSASGSEPSVAVRNAVVDENDAVTTTELHFVGWSDSGNVLVSSLEPGNDTPGAPVTVASGDTPRLAHVGGALHVVFVSGDAVQHAFSEDGGATFTSGASISGSTTEVDGPSIAAFGDRILVAWSGKEGGGDADIYGTLSADRGATFSEVFRMDDDPQGANQSSVSVTLDPLSLSFYGTWEDRRQGADVYFSSSEGGMTWATNVDVGTGLGGDQFVPETVTDVAGNVYVAFQDTTSGARVVFSRFNREGGFDPPLEPSTRAGSEGISADAPTVATDDFGGVYIAWQENRSGSDTSIFFARGE